MRQAEHKDVWDSGDAYEPYVGRWSRLVANEFLQWLSVPAGRDWLDVGCGTGALTQTILNEADPPSLLAWTPRLALWPMRQPVWLIPERASEPEMRRRSL